MRAGVYSRETADGCCSHANVLGVSQQVSHVFLPCRAHLWKVGVFTEFSIGSFEVSSSGFVFAGLRETSRSSNDRRFQEFAPWPKATSLVSKYLQ